ncbi:peptidylprolyl isomerase [Candidatus Protochlamydia phocaeensis]|uniref:peptidylprolyl isomerase n=1 Tax=Candidatus Protochlamydia phocaeensis TaxID=1414722 RepID=UPI000AF204BB|nr:peptidyl-prolyl cis-trans isomerase [Candidatus Protochlamydia phocaeensis]
MKNKLFTACLSFLIGCSSLYAIKSDPLLSGTQREEPKIFVNNRILAKINGKPISTYDVMKKMDITFYKQYPEYMSSPVARYQYYQYQWKMVLEDLIYKELILADAKESKVEVSSGDVRQEMEEVFGPNIIANLDKVGMSFDEAAKIVQGDILIRRMLGARVNGKALRLVTPSKVRKTYEEFIQDPQNSRSTVWSYRVVTIKDRNLQKTEETAKATYQLLMEGAPLDELIARLKEHKLLGRKGKVTVSDVITNNEKELSASYKEVLEGMDTGMYSQPFAHKSRKENATVYRIFYVKEKVPGGFPSFKEMESTLKERLLNEIADQETEVYLQKLRQHFHVRESDIDALLPADYQPFILK